jgi:hypothetical protein
MTTGDSSLFLPRTAVRVRLRLADGEAREGDVFVMDRVPYRDGPETVLEMLNREEDFYAFRPTEGPPVLLVARSHTATVTVDAAGPLADPARRAAAQAVALTVSLTTGDALAGEAQFEAPLSRQRALDYLIASRDPFFALTQGETTTFINRTHVRHVQPGA